MEFAWSRRAVCWMSMLALALACGLAQVNSPAPRFPGGGLWKAPPNRAVPVEIADGLVIAKGAISGGNAKSSGLTEFVVDSAATATVVDAEMARKLGWKASGPNQYEGRTLELAGASVSGKPIFGMSLDGLAEQAGVPVEGVAGSDIFQHFAVRIDYIQHWMMLMVPESCATPEKKLAVRIVGGLPFVQASVAAAGGQTVSGLFLVDTGQAGTGLILTSEFLAKHPDLTAKQPVAHMPAFDPAHTVRDTAFLRVDTLQLAGNTLRGVVAAVAPATPGKDSGLAGVIGGGVLSRFDLLVDLPRRLMSLTPNADFALPFEADMSGMLLSGETSGRPGEATGQRGEPVYTVAGIEEKSPASEAGLRTGDKVVEVAGKNVREMNMEMIRGILKSGPGTRLMIGVDRSGKKFQVVLTLRRAV